MSQQSFLIFSPQQVEMSVGVINQTSRLKLKKFLITSFFTNQIDNNKTTAIISMGYKNFSVAKLKMLEYASNFNSFLLKMSALKMF